MRPTPLQTVKEQHGSKSDLINKLVDLLESDEGESADDHKRRLRNVSNAKLLHLLSIGERAKAVGGRDGLVAKVLELKGQAKDHEYSDALKKRPLGELLDMVDSLGHRAGGQGQEEAFAPTQPKELVAGVGAASPPWHPQLEPLERVLQTHEPQLFPAPARVSDLAAVALILAGPAEDLRVCFIRRASRDADPWSGQMAFPGGRRDPQDASVRQVAERETAEEVGLGLHDARLLGRLSDGALRRARDGVLAAFVYDAGRVLPELQPDPAEVAATFWIRARHLWDPAYRTQVAWSDERGITQYPGIAHGPDVIWGLSLRVLGQLGALLGLPLPKALPIDPEP